VLAGIKVKNTVTASVATFDLCFFSASSNFALKEANSLTIFEHDKSAYSVLDTTAAAIFDGGLAQAVSARADKC
jgi:hypothetical protein